MSVIRPDKAHISVEPDNILRCVQRFLELNRLVLVLALCRWLYHFYLVHLASVSACMEWEKVVDQVFRGGEASGFLAILSHRIDSFYRQFMDNFLGKVWQLCVKLRVDVDLLLFLCSWEVHRDCLHLFLLWFAVLSLYCACQSHDRARNDHYTHTDQNPRNGGDWLCCLLQLPGIVYWHFKFEIN